MTTSKSEMMFRDLFEPAGIEINGKNAWDIQVHNPRFYDRIFQQVHLGAGESYMDGWWDCESMDEMINRALRANIDTRIKGDPRILLYILKAKLLNLQAPSRAFEVGEEHYDLGNDLYTAMLDKRLNYTCAYWKGAKNLDEAQEAKLELVCQKIGIKPGMRILELGCGWGSFAKYAAEKYGTHVLGVTVSKEQVALGMELCKGLPVELRLQDYRQVEGKYDAVISIGVMEHVGYKNYRTYMEVVDRCLKEDGIAFIHTIGGNISVLISDPFTTKYIFPNSMLPSITQLGAAMEGKFVMEDWHNIGPHYDPTLMAWYANFEKAWHVLSKKYSERFRRMWRFYLLSGAGGFRSRHQQLWQIVMTRIGTKQPDCRKS
ncbi:MAG: cyclopropane fatty acyl phospholipid synthase [Anaerolineaceae bacterium]|nr:cyclopropane fatty acyl phospholipid synthase [Anaerolineaceae bacterium]